MDLLAKLGREDDAYHSTCLVLIEYSDDAAVADDDGYDSEDRAVSAGLEPADVDDQGAAAEVREPVLDAALLSLPSVHIRHDATPPELSPGRFLAMMVDRVLDATPVNLHGAARERRRSALGS